MAKRREVPDVARRCTELWLAIAQARALLAMADARPAVAVELRDEARRILDAVEGRRLPPISSQTRANKNALQRRRRRRADPPNRD